MNPVIDLDMRQKRMKNGRLLRQSDDDLAWRVSEGAPPGCGDCDAASRLKETSSWQVELQSVKIRRSDALACRQ
ncbi:hypothetical protein AA23498_0881 [Acetobacter nitrogenifigens DSM 23921 = NBRC 105050]|nr:hypothetical protein AA23498_0881 [Acetobacter nitrogenifigens DSM 23921 = NBRC 105050]